MNEKVRRLIESHIEIILEDSSFKRMKVNHPDKCPYFTADKPCHSNIPEEEFSCFFCLCPRYNNSKPEGGCVIGSRKGKWFYHSKLQKGKIWDCSCCDYPHRKETVRNYLRRLFDIKGKE